MSGVADESSGLAEGLTAGDVPSAEDIERGQSLLSRISTEVVRTFKEYYGKGPTSAKSYMFDDMLFVVMRGGLNASEKFLLEKDEVDVVRQYRQTFENRMNEVLSEKIESLTGKTVIGFNSQILFDPDISIEIFIFDDRGTVESIEATAAGQIAVEVVGEVSGDAPAKAGSSGSNKAS